MAIDLNSLDIFLCTISTPCEENLNINKILNIEENLNIDAWLNSK